MNDQVLIVTTPTVEGHPARDVIGYVSADAVWEAEHLAARRFDDGWDKGRYGLYEALMGQLRRDILRDIRQQALERGANAIVGFTICYGAAPLLQGAGGAPMACSGDRWFAHGEGTAIRIEGHGEP